MRPRSLRFVLPLVAAVALGPGLVGCGGDEAEVAPVVTPDAPALLRSAAERVERLRSFHFLLEHEHGGTEIVRGIQMTRAEGDLVLPDKMKADIQGNLGRLNLKVGIVILGAEAWIQNPLSGRWERERISLADIFNPATGVPAVMRKARDPRITGREDMAGVAVYRIEANVDSADLREFVSGAPPGRSVPAVVWIGVTDPLVHRVDLLGPVAQGEAKDLERRLTLTRFDADGAIQPPR